MLSQAWISRVDNRLVGTLRQIVYVSAAVRLMRDSELLSILESARTSNNAQGLTGLLLYADGAFIQVLEGDPQTVERLMRKIRRDQRHHRFLILLDRVTGERDFDDSSMGFCTVTGQELQEIAGYQDWSAAMPTRRKSAAALRLIESFRRTAAAAH